MQPWQNPHPSQIPATKQPGASKRSLGNLIGIVLGSLFATCFVFAGVAALLEDDPESAEPEPSTRGRVADAATPEPIGPLTTPECEAALRNVDRLLPGAGQGAPAGACRDAATWEDPGEWRCAAKAEQLAELQLCGSYWMTLVATYMEKQSPSSPSPTPEGGVAADLGLGSAGRKRLAKVAKAYGATELQVGDKAVKASELCLGRMDAVARNPAGAVRKVEGALEFAAGIAENEATRKAMPLDDLFVTYVTMECPDPSGR